MARFKLWSKAKYSFVRTTNSLNAKKKGSANSGKVSEYVLQPNEGEGMKVSMDTVLRAHALFSGAAEKPYTSKDVRT